MKKLFAVFAVLLALSCATSPSLGHAPKEKDESTKKKKEEKKQKDKFEADVEGFTVTAPGGSRSVGGVWVKGEGKEGARNAKVITEQILKKRSEDYRFTVDRTPIPPPEPPPPQVVVQQVYVPTPVVATPVHYPCGCRCTHVAAVFPTTWGIPCPPVVGFIPRYWWYTGGTVYCRCWGGQWRYYYGNTWVPCTAPVGGPAYML